MLCAGLDAFAALSIMDYVAQLAAKGHTCIATIHAPRTAIWAKFHKVGGCAFFQKTMPVHMRQPRYAPPGRSQATRVTGNTAIAIEAALVGFVVSTLAGIAGPGVVTCRELLARVCRQETSLCSWASAVSRQSGLIRDSSHHPSSGPQRAAPPPVMPALWWLQVSLLSEGRLMYFGAPDEATLWFDSLG